MLQCAVTGAPGKSGQISLTLSQSVTTRSKRIRAKRSRCLVVRPEMSIPRSAITRMALRCSGFGWLPALRASTAPSERLASSASAICERAEFPVHRNRTRCLRRVAARGSCTRKRGELERRMQRRPGRDEELAAAGQVQPIIRVAPISRTPPRPTPAPLTAALRGDTRRGSGLSPPAERARRPAGRSAPTGRQVASAGGPRPVAGTRGAFRREQQRPRCPRYIKLV